VSDDNLPTAEEATGTADPSVTVGVETFTDPTPFISWTAGGGDASVCAVNETFETETTDTISTGQFRWFQRRQRIVNRS
jgi:hypothetical protein